MNVRLARVDDVRAVAAVLDDATLFLRSLGGAEWKVPFPQDELRERVARDELYVVESDGAIAGTFTLLWEDLFFWGDRGSDAGYLHKLAVPRSLAGRGIGASAVEWVDAEVAARGREFVRLDCQRDLPGIRHYYEALGFELRGEKVSGHYAWALYERRVRT